MSAAIRVARIIARLNVGGPARHVTALAARLPSDFQTRLFVGDVSQGEREMTDVIAAEGIEPIRVEGLGRAIRAGGDARAFATLVRELRKFRPHIVHTHTAKAGTLGRIAALAVRTPVIVHTFHGHVFDGYFSPSVTRAFRAIEQTLAYASDAIVTISPRQRDDIVEKYRVAPAGKVHVVPLGFDFASFDASPARGSFRREIGIPADASLVAAVGRITAIKDYPLLVRAFACLTTPAHLVFVGGGEEEARVRALASELGLASRVHFAGFQSALARVLADVDVVALSSKNEGTPVALIEALVAGCTPVAVDVGGVADVLDGGRRGKLVIDRSPHAIARALDEALSERSEYTTHHLAENSRWARQKYGIERLVSDHVALYNRLLQSVASR